MKDEISQIFRQNIKSDTLHSTENASCIPCSYKIVNFMSSYDLYSTLCELKPVNSKIIKMANLKAIFLYV